MEHLIGQSLQVMPVAAIPVVIVVLGLYWIYRKTMIIQRDRELTKKNRDADSDISGTISDSHIASESTWNGKYTKPSTGIPKTDLASAVQTSLGKADTALQSHQSVTDNNPTLAWGIKSKVGKVGSTDLHVTMPAANADTYEVFVDSTSFTDALTAFNSNKKLLLKVGKAGSGAYSTTYYLPLYRVQFSGNDITQFVWMLDSDAYGDASGSNTYGAIYIYKLSESGWSSSSDNVAYAKNAGVANTCGKANLLDDWATTTGGKIAVGWDHDSIKKVTASKTGTSSMEESFHLAAYAGKSDGIARVKDVLAINVQVGKALDATKWNGWSIVVGSTGTDANTLYFV